MTLLGRLKEEIGQTIKGRKRQWKTEKRRLFLMDNSYLDMELLRFTTAGSVDDGKSTLIGRLLYDSKSIFEDQLDQVASSSKKRGLENTDLALLTDGLKDEREQGITIDVAYRYFATPKGNLLLPILLAIFSIREIWLLVRPRQILP